MARFLVDVNLPYRFSLWHGSDYIHLRDVDDELPDRQVWLYAKRKGLTIVTKDADFSERALLEPPPPRVIHVRVGNLKMRDFHQAISGIWPEVCELSALYRLVNVFADRIEGIG
jgi:predicted nuclease of predicted toxin-antitoxin system